MVRFYWTYILQCADDSYYVGMTNHIDKRVQQHQEGNNPRCHTYSKRPVKLVYSQMFLDPDHAIAMEKRIKGWTRVKKEALINGEFDKLPGLSKKKFRR